MKKSEALRVLGLRDGASDDAVKKAHREKVIANHPDKFAQNSAKKAAAEETMKKVNEARDVLLSRKWEPEFGRGSYGYGNPGSPFGGYSRGGPARPGSSGGPTRPSGTGSPFDPFAGSPFGTPGSSPFDSSDPFNPFVSQTAQTTQVKTAEQQRDEAKEDLKGTFSFIVVKLVIVTLIVVLYGAAGGPLTYALLTAAYALYRRFGNCFLGVAIPLLVMVGSNLLALVRTSIALFLGSPLAFFALIYDVRLVIKLVMAYFAARKKVRQEGKS